MKSAFAETRQHMGVVGSVATEILAAVRAVKAFNGENRAYQRFSDVTADLDECRKCGLFAIKRIWREPSLFFPMP